MSENRLPPSFRACATCALWGGTRTSDPLRTNAIYESDQTGRCMGGSFNMGEMNPLASCGSWEVWAVLGRR